MRNPCARAVLAGVLGLGLTALALAGTSTERMATGEQRVLKPGYAVGDIAISNPRVCDFRVLGNRTQVMLIANGVGFTTLTLWDQRGVKRDEITIEVISAEMAKLMADLAGLTRPYPGVTISTLGPRIVVGGTVNTREELDAVKMLAQGAGNALCTVMIAGGGQTAAPAGTPAPRFVPDAAPATAAPPAAKPPGAAGTASVVRDPTPPPVARTPVNTGPTPVPLGGGAGQPGVSAPPAATPPPVAVPAATAPPPPNVVTGTRPSPAPAPPAPTPAPGTVGVGAIEYLVAIYESPSSAPPPEISGPQGKRLLEARLRTDPGREVRQTITVGGTQNADPALMRGLSIALTPRVRGEVIESTLIFDTNLPIGSYEQTKDPVWLRSQIRITGASGATQYVTEPALAEAARPSGAAPPPPSGSGAGTTVAGAAIHDGVSTATRALPGSQYVPSLGGLFSLTARSAAQPKARPTMLLLVITPAIVGPIGRQP